MDSGNTAGSLHSSEEECNSRAAALQDSTGFITTHSQPPPPPPFNHQNLINNPFFFTPSSQHHLIDLHSKTLPSFFPSPSSTQPAAPTTDPTPLAAAGGRNPKKRSRASRRAPTTVMATDTNSFRAMVQQFTGINHPSPPPPFTSSSSSLSTIPNNLTTSFDVFGKQYSSASSAMMRSTTNNFDNLPQLHPNYYLLHSFPQNYLQSSSPSYSTSFLDMQNTVTFASNFSNQSPLIHSQKTTQKFQRNEDQVNVKESSGMKDGEGFIEPWNISSD